ncbi:MAG: hypothetical protein WKG52_08320 [Variovorax sp.]
MQPSHGLRPRVAVVDPAPRSREHIRRAIRALGHAPLVFTSIDELLAAGNSTRAYALMCFGVPAGVTDIRRVAEEAKEVVGREVPVMFATPEITSKTLRSPGRMQPNEFLAVQSCFSDIYNALEELMIRERIPMGDPGLAWGRYRFFPSCASVRVARTDVRLDTFQFELALEFFHNPGRILSPAWLQTMVNKPADADWTEWLEASVEVLRAKLSLGPSQTWKLGNAACGGYCLSSNVKKRRSPVKRAAEGCT